MTRNVELLQQTMQYINDHPEQHNQNVFVGENECGTAACFAGWGAMLSGWTVRQINASVMWVVGAQLFGLTQLEAERLFYYRNTIPVLELMVKDLVNGDVLRAAREYSDEL